MLETFLLIEEVSLHLKLPSYSIRIGLIVQKLMLLTESYDQSKLESIKMFSYIIPVKIVLGINLTKCLVSYYKSYSEVKNLLLTYSIEKNFFLIKILFYFFFVLFGVVNLR